MVAVLLAIVGAYAAGSAHADAQWRTYVPDHVTSVCADADCWPLPTTRP
jgi:hypothetical protein